MKKRNRKFLAYLLAISLMSTNVAPVFAAGNDDYFQFELEDIYPNLFNSRRGTDNDEGPGEMEMFESEIPEDEEEQNFNISYVFDKTTKKMERKLVVESKEALEDGHIIGVKVNDGFYRTIEELNEAISTGEFKDNKELMLTFQVFEDLDYFSPVEGTISEVTFKDDNDSFLAQMDILMGFGTEIAFEQIGAINEALVVSKLALESLTHDEQKDVLDKRITDIEQSIRLISYVSEITFDAESGVISLSIKSSLPFDTVKIGLEKENLGLFEETAFKTGNFKGSYFYEVLNEGELLLEDSHELDVWNETVLSVMESIEGITPSKANYEDVKALIDEIKSDIALVTNEDQKTFLTSKVSPIEAQNEEFRPIDLDEITKPVISKVFDSNFKMDLEISEPEDGFTLVYKDGENDLKWKTGFSISRYPEEILNTVEFKFIKGSLENIIAESHIETIEFYNDNKLVTNMDTTLKGIMGSTITSQNVIAKRVEYNKSLALKNKMMNPETKSAFDTELAQIKAVIDRIVGENPTLEIDELIEAIPDNKAFNVEGIDNILGLIKLLPESSDRLANLNSIFNKVEKNDAYKSGNLKTLESIIKKDHNVYEPIDSSNIGFENYRIMPTEDGYKVFVMLDKINASASSWKGLLAGEFDAFLTSSILYDIKDILNENVGTVTFELYGADGSAIKTYKMNSDVTSLNFDDIENIVKYLPNSYEGLDFDYYYFLNGDSIGLLMDGDFAKDDSLWEDVDKKDFDEFLKSAIAEPLIIKFEKDVIIGIVDEDHKILKSLTVVSKDSNNGNLFSSLQSKIQKEFSRFENLRFDYSISGTSKRISLRMVGSNFRETYDEWEGRDKNSFEDFVEDIVRVIMGDYDADVDVRVYDRNLKLVDEFKFENDRFEGSLASVEDHLNNRYNKFQGVYFEYSLKRDGNKNTLTIEADVLKSDRDWKDMDMDAFDEFVEDVANYVITQTLKDLDVEVIDFKRANLKNYKFKTTSFGKIRTFQDEFNALSSSFEGLRFKYSLTNDRSVNVAIDGTNFLKDDPIWVNINKDALTSWLETRVVDPLIAEFEKDVSITIYDKKGQRVFSESFKYNYKLDRFKQEIKELDETLNTKYDIFTSNGETFRLTHKVKLEGDQIFIVSRLSNFSAQAWQKIDRSLLDQFLESIGLEATALFGKAVEVKLTDHKDNTLITKKVSPKHVDLVKNIGIYPGSITNNSFLINEQSIETRLGSVFTYKLDRYMGSLIGNAVMGDFTGKTPVMEFNVTATNHYIFEDSVLEGLSSKGIDMAFRSRDLNYTIDAKSVGSQNSQMTIKREDIRKLNPQGKMSSSNIYNIGTTNGLTGKVELAYNPMHKGKPGFGVYKFNQDRVIWEPVSAQDTGGKFVIEDVSKGTYGVMYNGSNSFSDLAGVPEGYEIMVLAEKGVLGGKGEGLFAPNDRITRAELAKLAVVGFNFPEVAGTNSFADVKEGTWFYKVIESAKASNVIGGYNGAFRPNDNISREEVFSVLDRVNTQTSRLEQAPQNEGSLPNGSISSPWASGSLNTMRRVGVIDQSTPFVGKDFPSRAETSRYLYNLLFVNDRL